MSDQAFTKKSVYGTTYEAMYAGATSFMRRQFSKDLKNADVAISGIPYDCATTNRPGARFGPRAIRIASTQLAWAKHFPTGMDVFKDLAVIDYGDAELDTGEPQKIPDIIEKYAQEIIKTNTKMLTFGGDHFITYPILKAHHTKYGPMSLIHFDAHSDTWQEDKK